MKRPQGFDRVPPRRVTGTAGAAGGRAAGARGGRSREPAQDSASPGGGESAGEPITEPIPIIPGEPERPERSAGTKRSAKSDSTGGLDGAQPSRPSRVPSPARATRERRRYERSEVKRFTRRSRRRRLIWLGSIATVVVVLAATVLVALSPLMAVRTIDVVGTTRVDASAVRASLASQLGKPLPLVDYGSVREALKRYPLIRSYSTEAVPPGTLVVRIVERTPIGLLRTGSGYDLVDQAGVVISSTKQKPGGYPLITSTASAGSAAAKTSFAASAAVLGVLPANLLPKVSAITASSSESVTFTMDGKSVTWGGTEDAALKATVLAALVKAAPKAHAYDVSSPHAPVVR